MTGIDEWAKQRTCDLANAEAGGPRYWRPEDVESLTLLLALAKHVMKYEQPPVDPLLVEARKICADLFCFDDKISTKKYLAGKYDHFPPIKSAHAALKRGIEMAKEQNDG